MIRLLLIHLPVLIGQVVRVRPEYVFSGTTLQVPISMIHISWSHLAQFAYFTNYLVKLLFGLDMAESNIMAKFEIPTYALICDDCFTE
uniref:Uncharacterized protein n=1 Tax=Romanomermis culicivorax TaxID=13658 RepID=A0A915KLQ7_ROMCU